MKNTWRWAALVLTIGLLAIFGYGIVTGMFLTPVFWLVYITLVIIDLLVINYLKRTTFGGR